MSELTACQHQSMSTDMQAQCGIPQLQSCLTRLLWHCNQVLFKQLSAWCAATFLGALPVQHIHVTCDDFLMYDAASAKLVQTHVHTHLHLAASIPTHCCMYTYTLLLVVCTSDQPILAGYSMYASSLPRTQCKEKGWKAP